MENKGKLMLIDPGDVSAVHPVIELIHSYMVFKLISSGHHGGGKMSFVNMIRNMRRALAHLSGHLLRRRGKSRAVEYDTGAVRFRVYSPMKTQ